MSSANKKIDDGKKLVEKYKQIIKNTADYISKMNREKELKELELNTDNVKQEPPKVSHPFVDLTENLNYLS